MPQTHKNYPYVQNLIKNNNIEKLEEEKEKIEKIIIEYKTLLKENLTEFSKNRIEKNIEHEEKLLNYINENLEKLYKLLKK